MGRERLRELLSDILHSWSRSRSKETLLALLRILGPILDQPRQQVHNAAEFFGSHSRDFASTRATRRRISVEDVNVSDASPSIASWGDTSFGMGEPYLSLDHSPGFHSPAQRPSV